MVICIFQEQQPWSYQESVKNDGKSMVKSEFPPTQQSVSPEIATIQTNPQSGFQTNYNQYNHQHDIMFFLQLEYF